MFTTNNRIAHRGIFDNKTIPENSLQAFRYAVIMGYAIELDVQLTKDDVLVVFHDEILQRMTGVFRQIDDVPFKELRQMRLLHSDEPIPTLKEVLELVDGRVLILIEIKNTMEKKKLCKLLMEEIADYQNVILQTFSPRIVRYIKCHWPEQKVGYLIPKQLHPLSCSDWLLRFIKADFLAIHKDLLETERFQKLKEKYPLFLWTVNKNDEIADADCMLICNELMN